MLNQHKADLQLKISIGLRLFFSFLISIVSVVALSLFVMREKVAKNFSNYAVQIEFDRLHGLYQNLQDKYEKNQNWNFIVSTPEGRKNWLTQELVTLVRPQTLTNDREQHVAAVPQEKLVAPHLPSNNTRLYEPQNPHLPPLPPPAPPEPPAPPSPPAPLEHTTHPQGMAQAHTTAHTTAQATPSKKAHEYGSSSINSNDLYQRISLLDADGHYLAGRPLGDEASTARPIFVNKTTVGFLVLSHPDLPSDTMAQEFMEAQKNTIALLLFMSVALSALLASLLARHFRGPIQQLVSGAEQLEMGHFEARLSEERSDELGRLAHSFNQLASKLGELEQQRRQWVADTSHELRTPISVMRAQLEALQDGIRPSNAENLALLHRQVMSLNKLIDELYTLARSDLGALEYHFEPCNLQELLMEVVADFEEKLSRAGMACQLQIESTGITINADVERLRQVFTNLIENSIRYTHAPGLIHIRLSKDHLTDYGARVVIEDSAPAVPDQALQRLGERFFRLDSSRNRERGGAGLGLALCLRIIEKHQGQIVFTHSDLGGLKADILFKHIISEEKNA